MKQLMMWLIRFYRNYISPHKPPTCRFHPTCSAYALEAYEKHGFFKGSYLAITRVLRCHPLNPGGYDPVPEFQKKDNARKSVVYWLKMKK